MGFLSDLERQYPWLSRWLPKTAVAVVVVLVIGNAIHLSGFAPTSILGVDECWHAVASIIMAVSGGWVTTTTDMMSGVFHFDYPPLFHFLGAAAYRLFGSDSWPYLNVGIATAIFGLVLASRNGPVGTIERSALVLALLATPLFAMYSLRFYTEMLTAAVFFASWWWLALVLRDARVRDAIVSGIATGLLVWTKQTGFLVLALYVLIWGWVAVVGPTPRRRAMTWLVALAGGIACLYVAAMWSRGENPLLFAKSTSHPEVWEAAMGSGVRVPYDIFFDTIRATWGVVPFALLVLPVVIISIRGWREYSFPAHLLLTAVLLAVFLIDRRLVERHTLFLLPLIAFLGIDALSRLGRPALLIGWTALALAATVHVVGMPNYRVHFNPSRNFATMMNVIKTQTEPNATVATVWWTEVRYHTGRKVLWSLPNLEDPPVELFSAESPDQWYERLRARSVNYLLIDARYVTPEPSLGYSRPLLAFLPALMDDGRMKPVAERGPLSLYRVL